MFGLSWGAIGWTILTCTVGLVLWAARVPPDGAKSNLSQWIELLGWKSPSPSASRRPSLDHLAFYGSIAIWAIGTLLFALAYLLNQGSDLDTLYESALPTVGQQFHVNVHLSNRGSLKAFGLQTGGGIGFTNLPITEPLMSQKFDAAYLSLARNPENIGNEIQPGASESYFTVDGPLFDQRMVDEFTAGRATLYLVLVTRHKDSVAAWYGQWRYTESCVLFQNNGAVQLCHFGRNRTYTGS